MTPDPTILERTIPIQRSAKFYLSVFDRMRANDPTCKACGGDVAADGMMLDVPEGPFLACWECAERKATHHTTINAGSTR